MEKEKQVDEDLAISLAAERDEERLAMIAESGDEPEAVKAEEELAAGVEKSDDFDVVEGDVVEGDTPAGDAQITGIDGFDVPTINSSKGDEAKEEEGKTVGEPYRTISARTLHNEMQMAFLDARLLLHNTFDHVTEDDQTSGMKGRLKRDLNFKEYVELVTKVGITLTIARFTSLGIKG